MTEVLIFAEISKKELGCLDTCQHLSEGQFFDDYSWLIGEYFVMTWLLNSLEKKISGSVMFFTTTKKM